MRRPIVAVDPRASIATLAGDSGGTAKTPVGDVNARFYLENAREALDTAGEWLYDAGRDELLYWPLETEDLARDEVIVSFLPTLVRLEGRPAEGQPVKHIQFRRIGFRHTDWDPGPNGFADEPQAAVHVPAAFEAVGAEHCSVEECSFSQLGGYGISFGRAARSNRITANTISDVGAGGIKLGDTRLAPTPREKSEDNLVSDNHIHHIGQVYQGAIGILVLQSSNNQIVHNHIHHTYYTGISVGWTWGYEPNQCSGNRIEYNSLHHICQGLLNDVGAIYTLGVQPGTTIRNNLIHEVRSFAGKGRGIYLDEGSAEILVENNIVYRVKSAGFHQHYGRDNLIRNNIFAWNDEFQFSRARQEDHRSYTFEGNIVLFDRGGLLGGNWDDTGFEFSRNLYYDTRGEPLRFGRSTWKEWRARGHDVGSLVADPGFAHPAGGDFTLPTDSPAWKIGFHRIDLNTVGPRAGAEAGRVLPDME
jgi:parallel beta-helix repeat protein